MDLMEFLLARIAEDERLAAQVLESGTGVEILGQRNGAVPLGPFDPARVLAECKAKRRILAREQVRLATRPRAAPWTAATLATLYADHPDYRAEWRPSATQAEQERTTTG